MSLVLSREVSAGPTVGFQTDVVAPPSAYVSNRKVNASDFSAAAAAAAASSSYCCLEKKKEEENELSVTGDSADGLVESAELSLESSSIGVAGESTSSTVDGDDDDEGEEVQSKFKGGGGGVGAFGSLGSLEESLPIKRGLSNYYSGKSKSFANLSDVSRVEDLAKSESPFNKKRRILMSCKYRSLYNQSLNPTTSMPLLAVLDEDEEDQTEDRHHHHRDKNLSKNMEKKAIEDSDDDSPPSSSPSPSPSPLSRKFKSFKSGKCFSLTDLQNP